jgi:hypothetical protein
MFDISSTSAVGYVLIDRDMRIVSANSAFSSIVRADPKKLHGALVTSLFAASSSIAKLIDMVFDTGYYVKARSIPVTFMHWPDWEEHSYDATAQLMGTRGEEGACVLLRFQEALSLLAEDTRDVRSILRHARRNKVLPMFSGEDMEGRKVDVYMHPAAHRIRDRVPLVMVYRDNNDNITFEFDDTFFERLALAQVIHVKSER